MPLGLAPLLSLLGSLCRHVVPQREVRAEKLLGPLKFGVNSNIPHRKNLHVLFPDPGGREVRPAKCQSHSILVTLDMAQRWQGETSGDHMDQFLRNTHCVLILGNRIRASL